MSTDTPSSGPGSNTGHGHVWERPDGMKARCGGPGTCKRCAADAAQYGQAVPDTTPAPLGFYVLVREHDRWVADWDGELHPTREAGEKSLAEARKDGWEAVLTAAVPFPINTEEG